MDYIEWLEITRKSWKLAAACPSLMVGTHPRDAERQHDIDEGRKEWLEVYCKPENEKEALGKECDEWAINDRS